MQILHFNEKMDFILGEVGLVGKADFQKEVLTFAESLMRDLKVKSAIAQASFQERQCVDTFAQQVRARTQQALSDTCSYPS